MVTDGTTAGTHLVKDINPNSGSSVHFVSVGDTLLSAANDGTHGSEPWTTDGTTAGTYLIKDINPGSGSAAAYGIFDFKPLGGGLAMFIANDGIHGAEPWVTDGTAAGTRLIKDINPGPAGNGGDGIIAAVGHDRLLFQAVDPAHGNELWVTDGTESGTQLVKDINSGPNGSVPGPGVALGDGRVLFDALDGSTDFRNLWVSDGTSAGTRFVAR